MRQKTFSEPYLKRLFNRFNRMYWGNRLPTETTVRWASAREMKEEGMRKIPWGLYCPPEGKLPPRILLDKEIQKRKWGKTRDSSLLHEMVHLEGRGRDSHGPAFKRRVRRLMKLGAFDDLV